MGWFQSIANTISALWNGNYCQSRTNEDKNAVTQNGGTQNISPVNHNAMSFGNQSSGSQKIFSPELMMASSKITSTDWKYSSNPTEMDKFELCKRILKDSFPTDEGDDAKNTFNSRLSKCFEEKITGKKIRIGIDHKLKFSNLDDDESINQIAFQLNGLQNINDEQLKERINIILDNLDNKEAFDYYMGLYPKTPSGSRESSPGMDSSRESSPGTLSRGLFSPAGSMTPPSSISPRGLSFSKPPSPSLKIS